MFSYWHRIYIGSEVVLRNVLDVNRLMMIFEMRLKLMIIVCRWASEKVVFSCLVHWAGGLSWRWCWLVCFLLRS